MPLPLFHVYPFVVGSADAAGDRGGRGVSGRGLGGPELVSALRRGAGVSVLMGVPRGLYEALLDAIGRPRRGSGPSAGSTSPPGRRAISDTGRSRALIAAPLRRRLGPEISGSRSSGGAALDAATAWRLTGLGLTVLTGYGLTETSPIVSVRSAPNAPRPGAAGKPLESLELRIDEPDADGIGRDCGARPERVRRLSAPAGQDRRGAGFRRLVHHRRSGAAGRQRLSPCRRPAVGDDHPRRRPERLGGSDRGSAGRRAGDRGERGAGAGSPAGRPDPAGARRAGRPRRPQRRRPGPGPHPRPTAGGCPPVGHGAGGRAAAADADRQAAPARTARPVAAGRRGGAGAGAGAFRRGAARSSTILRRQRCGTGCSGRFPRPAGGDGGGASGGARHRQPWSGSRSGWNWSGSWASAWRPRRGAAWSRCATSSSGRGRGEGEAGGAPGGRAAGCPGRTTCRPNSGAGPGIRVRRGGRRPICCWGSTGRCSVTVWPVSVRG